MSAMGLTRAQSACLDFIRRRLQETGVPPSYEEMKRHLKPRSKSGIHRLVTALEERGAITRLRGRARAIRPAESGDGFRLALPAELEFRLRLLAEASGKTPEGVAVDLLRARLIAPAEKGVLR